MFTETDFISTADFLLHFCIIIKGRGLFEWQVGGNMLATTWHGLAGSQGRSQTPYNTSTFWGFLCLTLIVLLRETEMWRQSEGEGHTGKGCPAPAPGFVQLFKKKKSMVALVENMTEDSARETWAHMSHVWLVAVLHLDHYKGHHGLQPKTERTHNWVTVGLDRYNRAAVALFGLVLCNPEGSAWGTLRLNQVKSADRVQCGSTDEHIIEHKPGMLEVS